MPVRSAAVGTSGGRTAYTCRQCGRERFSSNPKADQGVGTTCPICALAEKDKTRHTLTATDRRA